MCVHALQLMPKAVSPAAPLGMPLSLCCDTPSLLCAVLCSAVEALRAWLGTHLLLKLVQLQGQQVVELEVRVLDVERDLGGGHELLPVAVAHGGAAQVGHQRHGHEEVLDQGVEALEAVLVAHLLVQALDLLHEALGAILHDLRLDVVPQRLAPVLELQLAEHDGVPHLLDGHRVVAQLLERGLDGVHQLRELEHGGQLHQAPALLLQVCHVARHAVQLGVRVGVAGGELEEGALAKVVLVVAHLHAESLNLLLDVLRLLGLQVTGSACMPSCQHHPRHGATGRAWAKRRQRVARAAINGLPPDHACCGNSTQPACLGMAAQPTQAPCCRLSDPRVMLHARWLQLHTAQRAHRGAPIPTAPPTWMGSMSVLTCGCAFLISSHLCCTSSRRFSILLTLTLSLAS